MTKPITKKRIASSTLLCLMLAACAEEPPPVTVSEFMENPRLLEATMVRCSENRAELKYEAECVNARDAVNRIAAREEKARREELERQSEQKRQALRRTQEAAAAARRRALEEQRRREEAEYLGVLEDGTVITSEDGVTVVTEPPSMPAEAPQAEAGAVTATPAETEAAEPVAETGSDLDAIREELKRRQQAPQ